ncbi:alkaline phosphatase family protein [Leekyejoonella antrihumi]|uniref:Alkaline phosphatase family protein n=1 Tax=Leekyejoonella antrihumi TaxID=1660198 RepID=A0A563E8T6_9MICO|nr:alkaline phosphatase family protein [Leekyejoonella antrihumi]TWP38663.1 hypothetical protein FGL98_02450 [Leekyejoonella antrihumi]
MRRMVRSASILLLTLALSSAVAQARSATPSRQPAAQGTASTPLRHIVVMSQEGHSFDNYFGHRAGVDGLPAGTCLPAPRGEPGPCVPPHPVSGSPHAKLRGTAAAQTESVDSGRMDGFVRAQAVHGSSGRVAMGYYPAQQLPVLTGVADRGVVFDKWFAAVPGSAVANDLFGVAATSPADVQQVPAKGWGDVPLIFDRLEDAGVSWRIYVENYQPDLTIGAARSAQQRSTGQVARVPALATSGFVASPSLRAHVVDLSRYYDDLARGRLPAVSFIVSTQHTELAPRNPSIDQRLVGSVVNGLLSSSAWQQSAFFLTYATSGGWYDHVPPPTIGGTRVGLRVPTVLLSPYVSAGTVNGTTYDSAAILKLIEQNWSLKPLTSRDWDAASLLPLFSFHADPARPTLVGVAPSRPPVQQPGRSVLYIGYLCALLAALVCFSFVVFRRWPSGSARETIEGGRQDDA